ncbi:WXG100 family type VII secretion target [Actinomycetota bacterium]
MTGDPAACSALGGALRRLADRLRHEADGVRESRDRLADQWPGRASVATRRRLDETARECTELADVLDRCGGLLQGYAAELADTATRVRAAEGRAAAAGLEVSAGRVALPMGVRGVADPAADAARAQELTAAQESLDAAYHRAVRQGSRLAASLGSASAALAALSGRLRTRG